MKKGYDLIRNEHGSALLWVLIFIPVFTLLVMFASQVAVQDLNVTGNDKCHRIAFYNSDGAAYGTAKLISLIGKSETREAVEAGDDKDAPGIEYLNTESDPAEYFRHLLTSEDSEITDDGEVKFIKADKENDIGLDSTVDLTKLGPGGTPAGGGAEFGSGGEGIGAQMSVVIFRLRSQGRAPCSNTTATVVGDYWLITNKDGRTKGI